jgi:predicted ribosome quality control (RQC) complex YloA/Tae2 family protein
MSDQASRLLSSLSELLTIYQEAKKVVKIYETKSPSKKLPSSALNELRNCLDHIMRSIENPDRQDHEINEAKEHTYRVFYDTVELLCIDCVESISSIMSKYEIHVISEAFPDYYTQIKPKLLEFQDQLSKKLVQKNIDPKTNNKALGDFEELVSDFNRMQAQVHGKINELEATRKRRKRFFTKEVIVSLIVGFVTGSASSFFIWWLTKDN